ncbi:orexin receptor type 2-like isoform X1 [Diprion similis]|uniref:orexin receptor type 2-like isoform X1 n=1 Tax=Diprion similis TaxID=362088 RepID=UPI001EF7D515|nr:orexin receptor type 2-like isoform X1 [Diprion similis]
MTMINPMILLPVAVMYMTFLVNSVVTTVNETDYEMMYNDVTTDEYDVNDTSNCTDYCVSDDEYIELMENHIFPDVNDWILIAMHSVVFVAGLVGNALVCVAVYRNHSMRTVTNYFIVNLAVADLLVILICLPPTVVWDVTETWFLGLRLCKAVPYFQTVSVSVSILTLTFISIDRWYAICFPLKFKSTTSRAKTAIIIIWVVALLFDLPDLMVLQTVQHKYRVETIFFTQCAPSWSHKSEATFIIIKLVILYTAPLLFMSIAYWQIVRVLWRSDIPGHNFSSRGSHVIATTNNPGNLEGQLRSRRKAAKMLVAVVLMFAVCYFPVHLLSILRYTVELKANQTTKTISLLAHWLCYANSAVNPLIYNFMSGKFRKEFRRTFCCPGGGGSSGRGAYKMARGGSTPCHRSNTNNTRSQPTNNNNNVQQSTELIPLSAVTNPQKNDKRDQL